MSRYQLERKLKNQFIIFSVLESTMTVIVTIGAWFVLTRLLDFQQEAAAIAVGALALILSILLAVSRANMALKPLRIIAQALDHVSEKPTNKAAPDLNSESLGKEYLSEILSDIYGLASKSPTVAATSAPLMLSENILRQSPFPTLAVDGEQVIRYANTAAADYTGKPLDELIGNNLADVFDFWFNDESTLEDWIEHTRSHTVTSSIRWERVKLKLPGADGTVKMFDMAATYSRGSGSGFEVIIGIFDHTERYSHDELDIGYIAMAIHELRTPITILRGYIEVLNDELGPDVSEEQKRFIDNMNAAAQSLTSFVSNILNIARIEENQLELTLGEASWDSILNDVVGSQELRAKVRGKIITLTIEPNLPNVAVDKITITEVINNMVENAIKYGGESKEIIIDAHLREGLVETTIEDHGVGIPSAAIGQIFGKFYRSHSSRGNISGTGLGLYISKKIIDAHGGQIWFKSKEGEGSLFGFMLQPYTVYIAKQSESGDKVNTKNVHGWIQNHSLYRK